MALALVVIFSVVAYSVAQSTTACAGRSARRARMCCGSLRESHLSARPLASFLGAILAHWMQSTSAAGSLFGAAAVLGLSASLACLLPAHHAIAVSPRRSSPL